MRGTTRVWPRENGAGWLTCGVSEMVTVRLPCATATVDDAHVAAHHDDAGALVDDDLGGEVGLDLQLLDLGEQRRPRCR